MRVPSTDRTAADPYGVGRLSEALDDALSAASARALATSATSPTGAPLAALFDAAREALRESIATGTPAGAATVEAAIAELDGILPPPIPGLAEYVTYPRPRIVRRERGPQGERYAVVYRAGGVADGHIQHALTRANGRRLTRGGVPGDEDGRGALVLWSVPLSRGAALRSLLGPHGFVFGGAPAPEPEPEEKTMDEVASLFQTAAVLPPKPKAKAAPRPLASVPAAAPLEVRVTKERSPHGPQAHVRWSRFHAELVRALLAIPDAVDATAAERLPASATEAERAEAALDRFVRLEVRPGALPALLEVAGAVGFDVPDDVRELYREVEERAEKLAALSGAGDLTPEAPWEAEWEEGLARGAARLRPFQRIPAAYAHLTSYAPGGAAARILLTDEMGLGKTVESLVAARACGVLDRGGLLVVCPATLRHNWAKESLFWLGLGADDVTVLTGRKPRRAARPFVVHVHGEDHEVEANADPRERAVTIVNYDVIAHRIEELRTAGFGGVIFDESHYVKNAATKRTSAARYIASGRAPRRRSAGDEKADDAAPIGWRACLTGTPVVNKPQDLIEPLMILGRIAAVCAGTKADFRRRYLRPGTNEPQNLRRLNELLRGSVLIRRTKETVAGDLPAKSRAVVEVDIDNRKEYEACERDVVEWVRKRAERRARMETRVAGLSGSARSLAIQEHARSKAERAAQAQLLVQLGLLKRLAGQGKAAAAADWCRDFLDGTDKKLVVFAHHKDVQALLVERLREAAGEGAVVHVLGDDSAEERNEAVTRFQNDDGVRVVVCSLRAAGVGITLTAASDVCFAEMGWTAAEMDQAEDRCHRIGQATPVTAWYLTAADTVEGRVMDAIEHKRSLAALAVDGAEAADLFTDVAEEVLSSLESDLNARQPG